jgi:hypothetical protein
MTVSVTEPTDSELFSALFLELRDGLERAKRLMSAFEAGDLSQEDREEALRGARVLAAEGRVGFTFMTRMAEESPELFPRYAIGLRVAARLAYCLHALSGEDPEPLALISPSELEAILDDEDSDGRLAELVAMVPPDRERGD